MDRLEIHHLNRGTVGHQMLEKMKIIAVDRVHHPEGRSADI